MWHLLTFTIKFYYRKVTDKWIKTLSRHRLKHEQLRQWFPKDDAKQVVPPPAWKINITMPLNILIHNLLLKGQQWNKNMADLMIHSLFSPHPATLLQILFGSFAADTHDLSYYEIMSYPSSLGWRHIWQNFENALFKKLNHVHHMIFPPETKCILLIKRLLSTKLKFGTHYNNKRHYNNK